MSVTVSNAFPELPEVPYQRTTVSMFDAIQYINSLQVSKNVKIAAYVIFREESGNGRDGVNNNYIGAQGDVAKWGLSIALKSHIVGTCVEKENLRQSDGSQKPRRFLCFDSYKASIDFLVEKLQARDIYVGGKTNSAYSKIDIKTPEDWVLAYWKEWEAGDIKAVPSKVEANNLLSIYHQGITLFT